MENFPSSDGLQNAPGYMYLAQLIACNYMVLLESWEKNAVKLISYYFEKNVSNDLVERESTDR